jgi:hypothetical protein
MAETEIQADIAGKERVNGVLAQHRKSSIPVISRGSFLAFSWNAIRSRGFLLLRRARCEIPFP